MWNLTRCVDAHAPFVRCHFHGWHEGPGVLVVVAQQYLVSVPKVLPRFAVECDEIFQSSRSPESIVPSLVEHHGTLGVPLGVELALHWVPHEDVAPDRRHSIGPVAQSSLNSTAGNDAKLGPPSLYRLEFGVAWRTASEVVEASEAGVEASEVVETSETPAPVVEASESSAPVVEAASESEVLTSESSEAAVSVKPEPSHFCDDVATQFEKIFSSFVEWRLLLTL